MLGHWAVLRYGDEMFVLSGRTVLETLLASRPHLLRDLACFANSQQQSVVDGSTDWVPGLRGFPSWFSQLPTCTSHL